MTRTAASSASSVAGSDPGYAVAAVIYVAAAIALTWPLAASLTTHLGATQGAGDPFLNLWILGWGMHAWATDPLGVLTGRAFDANIFFPARDTLTYSDHFLLQALPLAPLYALTGDAVLCYNLLLLASLALSGLAMHALAKSATASTPAAFVAGLAWACWPYRTAHLLHIQLQALYFLPLALLALHRLTAGRRWRDAVMLGLMAGGQAIASVYYGVMTMIAVGVSAVALAVTTGQWRKSRLIVRLLFAAIFGLALVGPVLLPYQRSQAAQGFGRNLFEAANHSAAAQSYRQVPASNLLYGTTGLLAPRAPEPGQRDRQGVEHQLFPGVAMLALALIGAWAGWRRDARPTVIAASALVVVGVVLSLGPDGVRPLYAWLYDVVYGFQAIRAPARFAVVAMLGLALLAAIGLRELLARVDARARTLTAAVVFVVMALEYANAPLPLVPAPARHTAVGAWLASEPTPGAVLHLPLTLDIENTPFMVQSLEHWRPIVNGYSGQRPVFYAALVEALSGLPNPAALATLKELDVRFVISPGVLPGVGTPASPLIERARLDGQFIYEAQWTPESEVLPHAAAALPEPPLPGDLPFAAGETLTYEIRWDGGGVGLPAGSATLRVDDASGGESRWKFQAAAVTADWVSSFFEARDTFTTVADAALRPLQHVRQIREGRRRQDRVFIYDAAQRLVRTGQTADEASAAGALSLPWSPGARDAVTAFYYARAVVPPSGTELRIPIHEAGRNLILLLPAGTEEDVEYRGQTVRARRIRPVLQQRIERRRPVDITVWMSLDARRVPIVVELDAGFGRVRAELVDAVR